MLSDLERNLPDLEVRIEKEARAITAGQDDGNRVQLKVTKDEDISLAFLEGLFEKGEMKGRTCDEVNILHSKPKCKSQELHWDYDPAKIECLPRGSAKPASAILAMQDGARLMVFDETTQLVVPARAGDRCDTRRAEAAQHSASESAWVWRDAGAG